MCGIAGFYTQQSNQDSLPRLQKMTDALAHRGPDAQGHYSQDETLFLGHRRLSILDLDPRSNQPFEWLDRYVITFNGEIYNYLEIRAELRQKGYFFQTESDTEVICAAYNEWKEQCLERFDGMFAFVIYHKENKKMFAARDRFGEKPFYFAQTEDGFYFASEMKALWQAGIPKTLRKTMVQDYLLYDVVEDIYQPEGTFFEGIQQLKAGHYLTLHKATDKVRQLRYYYPSIQTRFTGTFDQAVERFKTLLEQSIHRRMRADVQLGASLSGGMDSSSVVAKMSQEGKEIFTFSARFPGFSKDEGVYIDEVSSYFGTKQIDIFPDESTFFECIDKMLYHQEEPFQSASVFAQNAVYERARMEKVLVLLDGQGADELLAGYFKFLFPMYYSLRSVTKKETFVNDFRKGQGLVMLTNKKQWFQFRAPYAFRALLALKDRGTRKKNGLGAQFDEVTYARNPFLTQKSLKSALQYNLMEQGLRKLLRFSDRNSMAHSIEVRLPFLSHELVDFVLSLPESFFFEKGWTKSILRNAMANDLPQNIVWRKDKVGFEAPDEQWLKQEKYIKLVQEAKKFLVLQGWITESYNNTWSIIILYRLLKSM